MQARNLTLPVAVLAVSMGLIAHALIGYLPFPFGDDFAYAPLTQRNADPTLFPRDDQLRMFANHAHLYEWLYHLGDRGPGVEPVFRVALWFQAVVATFALGVVALRLGLPAACLPLVLGLGVIVQTDGLGRGDVGGLIAMFFHHHNVALSLILAAVAASLGRHAIIAGAFLGLAAYAQPMTAAHGALILGLGTLLAWPRDTVKLVVTSVLVAIPASIMVLGQLPGAPTEIVDLDLIQDAYRFRAPHHYDPSWAKLGMTTLYLGVMFAGGIGLAKINKPLSRFALGAATGLVLLHAVSLFVYKLGIGEWVPFFVLDANRSSTLAFVLGPTIALAALWRAPQILAKIVLGLLLVALAAVNGTVESFGLIGLGLMLLVLEARFDWGARAAAVVAIGLLVILFPPRPEPPATHPDIRQLLERIREETPPDALFVIPIGLDAFRYFTQRSAYVDFKLFSVAQPDQAALTRRRIDLLVTPSPEEQELTGWPAVAAWGRAQRQEATCARMAEILAETEADFFLRITGPEEPRPDCTDLPVTIENDWLALYGPARPDR